MKNRALTEVLKGSNTKRAHRSAAQRHPGKRIRSGEAQLAEHRAATWHSARSISSTLIGPVSTPLVVLAFPFPVTSLRSQRRQSRPARGWGYLSAWSQGGRAGSA